MATNSVSNTTTAPIFVAPYINSYTGSASLLFEQYATPTIEQYGGRLPLAASRVTVYTTLLLAAFLEETLRDNSFAPLHALFIHMIAGSLYLPQLAAPSALDSEELYKFLFFIESSADIDKAAKRQLYDVLLYRIGQNDSHPLEFLQKVALFAAKKDGSIPDKTDVTARFFIELHQTKERPNFSSDESLSLLTPLLDEVAKNRDDFDTQCNLLPCFKYLLEQAAQSPEKAPPEKLLPLIGRFKELIAHRTANRDYINVEKSENLCQWLVHYIDSLSKEDLFQFSPLFEKRDREPFQFHRALLSRLQALNLQTPFTSSEATASLNAFGFNILESLKEEFLPFFKTVWEREKAEAENWTSAQLVSWIKFHYATISYGFLFEKEPDEIPNTIKRLKWELSLRQIDDCKSIPSQTFEVLIEPALKILKGDQLQSCQDMFDFLSHTSTLYSEKGKVSPATGFETFFDPIKKQILRTDRTFTAEESKALRGLLMLFYCYEQWDEEAFGKVSEIKIEAAKLQGFRGGDGIPNINDSHSFELSLRSLVFLRDLPSKKTIGSLIRLPYSTHTKNFTYYYLPHLLKLDLSLRLDDGCWKNDEKKRGQVKAVLSTLGLKSSDYQNHLNFECRAILEELEKENTL